MPASALYSIALLCEKVLTGHPPVKYFVPDGKRTVITQVQVTDQSLVSRQWVMEDMFTTVILLKFTGVGPQPNTETFEGRIVIPDDGGFGANGFTFNTTGDDDLWLYVGGYELTLP